MKESISQMHVLCEDWSRELLFFKDELPILKSRLEEVVSKNTSPEILKQVEHFENKFKLLGLHVDELLHDVTVKNDEINAKASTQAKYINVKMLESEEQMEEQMHINSTDFYQTKKEYYRFLASVL